MVRELAEMALDRSSSRIAPASTADLTLALEGVRFQMVTGKSALRSARIQARPMFPTPMKVMPCLLEAIFGEDTLGR